METRLLKSVQMPLERMRPPVAQANPINIYQGSQKTPSGTWRVMRGETKHSPDPKVPYRNLCPQNKRYK